MGKWRFPFLLLDNSYRLDDSQRFANPVFYEISIRVLIFKHEYSWCGSGTFSHGLIP